MTSVKRPRSHVAVILLSEAGCLLVQDDGPEIRLPRCPVEPNESPIAAAFQGFGGVIDLDAIRVLDQLNATSKDEYHLLMVAEGNSHGDPRLDPAGKWHWVPAQDALKHSCDQDRRILVTAYQAFGGITSS